MSTHGVLSTSATVQCLSEVGIPVARSAFAATLADVEETYEAVFTDRVVLKASGLLHKTELDGVVMNLADAEATMAAAGALYQRVGDAGLPFMIQEQASGLEMLVGAYRDPKLGAVLALGLGGVDAELHADVALRFAPVTRDDAREVLRSLRSWPLLDGYRGSTPCDVDALCDVISRVSELVLASPTIAELDLNPVVVRAAGEGCVVVDARIVTGAAPQARERTWSQLEQMLRPSHIAVVGASSDPSKVANRLFRYLVEHGYPGRLDPIHPAGGELDGRRRYSSLEELDGSPDLVCIAVPARHVPAVARQAVDVGAGAVVVHSSGFAEIGEEGARLEGELADILAGAGVPLLGPNSMGLVIPQARLTASISAGLEMTDVIAGGVGLISSSGALGSCIATRLMGARVGLSHWIHVGNEVDVGVADLLEWLANDPDTRTVGLLLEDIKDGSRLVSAGRRLAAAGIPVFAYSMGRSDKGREAALSHTSALLPPFELREEILRSAGIVSLPSLRTFEDALVLTAVHGLPRGNRLAAITLSGGAATVVADEAVRLGIELPEFSPATYERVRPYLPGYAAVRNPLDASYQMQSNPDGFRDAVIALLADGEFDAALTQFTTNADPFAEQLAQAVVEVSAVADVPVYVSRFGGEQLAPLAMKVYEQAGIPVLDAPDRATQAIGAVMTARAIISPDSRPERGGHWTSR